MCRQHSSDREGVRIGRNVNWNQHVEALISGVMAGRAIADEQDFDKMLSFLGKPGIKQLMYNTNIPFADIAGKLLKKFNSK